MTKYTIAIFFAFGMLLGGAGCKSDAEKFCAQEWVKKESGDEFDEKKCVEKITERAEKYCTNVDDVLSCMAEADNMEAYDKCEDKCDRKKP